MFSPEIITAAARNATTQLIKDLPPELGSRLKVGRLASRHGTELRMIEFRLWDRHQPGLLDYKYFGYTFIYDPTCRYHRWKQRQGGPCELLVRFYANRQRIYDQRDVVIPALWSQMLALEPSLQGFQAYQNDQVIGLFRFFDAKSEAQLEEQIYQAWLELIPRWHPHYAAVIDAYGSGLDEQTVQEVIAGRRKFQPRGPRFPDADPRYTRHIPSRLRQAILDRDSHRCVQCGGGSPFHIDHITPVAKGGLTTLENLQVLCAPCNLSKGAGS